MGCRRIVTSDSRIWNILIKAGFQLSLIFTDALPNAVKIGRGSVNLRIIIDVEALAPGWREEGAGDGTRHFRWCGKSFLELFMRNADGTFYWRSKSETEQDLHLENHSDK